ncbi:hypothetical protein LOD75_09240 [Xylella fastidiosa subsp. multiplex]|uniref:hypothetical protein n=1 Tax=Xylella fastidiosa TaxID=2371 RepID=UPI00030DF969|nr:hypothetical protein [Xylella fastidiosa]KAJ4853850.1 hypothetical protein XYFPCFBP8418_006445 [Xylella fastidiosa subsp. multiplex]MBE0276144.1 hypothetical protein [Xylella fastidiosa subsp. multiplex]MDD0879580.1 hypothetical protein [Xylella fastidiosa subsp. multiplex]MDD0885961.1 hypothetical protein [Xylella fastidiosa subsp. multiplex]MDD0910107.1 hypothetical protein [Xylella fastidiosa subsp. multiplex]
MRALRLTITRPDIHIQDTPQTHPNGTGGVNTTVQQHLNTCPASSPNLPDSPT